MLLATDLDGTFLAGDTSHRLRLYQSIARHPDIRLAYVTGRSLESVLPLLADPTLPVPDYIITDVGAGVYHGDTLQPIADLQSPIDRLWPGEQVVAEALADLTWLKRQDIPQLRRCSYFCEPHEAGDQELAARVTRLGCDLLYSAELYLDVLPPGVNKGSTLTALVDWLELEVEDVLVAGDTLNDLSLFHTGYKGVCVGGSEAGLLDETEGNARVLHAQEPGCGGIIEALAWFGFLGQHGMSAEIQQVSEPGGAELVIVYHRLPYEEKRIDGKLIRRRPTSPNGIIPTLLGLFGDGREGAWIAWAEHDKADGETFETHTAVDPERYPLLTCGRIPLSKSDVDVFYRRFSKEAFWPTLHTFWERASFREDHWEVFLRVNRAFAERAAEEAADGALVWLHDYNLWMVPAFLREMRPDLRIAFFHHTYFPSADVFNVVPWRREIIGSLLQCDYIGFHVPRQVENFVDVARGVTPIRILGRENCAPRFLTYGCAVGLEETTTAIEVNGRKIGLGAHPVGLDMGRVQDCLDNPEVQAHMQELRDALGDTRLILSVERLDYTKGTLEKLLAFERMLEDNPELQGKVQLTTVCVPAAAEMQVYQDLQHQIEQAVGRINGRFTTVDWTPVQFFFRPLPFEQVVAWYAMADVMWITPLRDGLNLVAKEFVAVQGLTEGTGVLVLSEFAGAAAELRGAVLTNPHDIRDLANTCYLALNLPASEARERLRQLFDIVRHHDIHRWSEGFIQASRGGDGKTTPAAAVPPRRAS